MWPLDCGPSPSGADALRGAAYRGGGTRSRSDSNYIAESDWPASAGNVLDRLLETAETLATFPERGSHPKELLVLGIRDYRQIFFKPYRVIYRVVEQRVYIYLIADGRRDMQSLLARRLLGA